jgi:hypothetical protein
MALTDKLKAIADAIRSKTGRTDAMQLDDMPDEILSISGGSDPFPYSGLNPQLVAEHHQYWGLDETSFVVGQSESTTATTILASVTNGFTTATLTVGDNDIVVIQRCCARPYHDGADGKAEQIAYAHTYVSWISKRSTNSITAKTSRAVSNSSSSLLGYRSITGAEVRAASTYGLYMTPTAPTVSPPTGNTTAVRIPSPALYYRVSATYEKAANIKKVYNCDFTWDVEIYTVDPFSSVGAAVFEANEGMIRGEM